MVDVLRRPDVLALIVAFDGALFDTLDVRTDALLAALREERTGVERDTVSRVLPGRSLSEAAAYFLGPDDDTLIDLVALRAQRTVSQRLAQGAPLAPHAREWIEAQQSAGHRVVLRADSIRRDVDLVMQFTDLTFAMIRCSDDLPRAIGVSSLDNSNAAIAHRLQAFGVSSAQTVEIRSLPAFGSGR